MGKMGTTLWQAVKTFVPFRLLEKEAMEIFNMEGRNKSQHEFFGMKLRMVREYFINPNIQSKNYG